MLGEICQQMLQTLRHNQGFQQPEDWLEYALTHHFQVVNALKLQNCPDCESVSFTKIGQYIYYSTLISLVKCKKCGLVFADTKLDEEIIKSHFENTYKDEAYFLDQRDGIFNQLATLTASFTRKEGFVLDIGGAKGHLLFKLKQRRPDLKLLLSDISENACTHASLQFGIRSLCGGGVEVLQQLDIQFDTVIMSDYLYYEPELKNLWKVLPSLMAKGGTVIIRVPNKLLLINSYQRFLSFCRTLDKNNMQDKIKFFNPEHLYVFSTKYLVKKLCNAGFESVLVMPSKLLLGKQQSLANIFYYASLAMWRLSFRRLVITPSLLIIGRKN